MVFIFVMTLWAMIKQVVFQWSGLGDADANMLLFILGGIILAFVFWIILEAFKAFTSKDQTPPIDPSM
jgi:carbon starvation protein